MVEGLHRTYSPGGSIFDIPDEMPVVWGSGNEALWVEGEAFILAGPSGVGKTTTIGQVVRALIFGGEVFGLPVVNHGKVLYLAMDRPAQIARSLRRHFTPNQRGSLDKHLAIWKGPPPGDFAKNPSLLTNMCQEAGAGVAIVDSLKDAAIGLSEDTVGAGYNNARQIALAAGVQVAELHHQTKRGNNGDKPSTLSDVYGSTWITSGAGSVALLWGSAGDPIVELRHLKQPADPVGPLKILHDHSAGLSRVIDDNDPKLILAANHKGMTARDMAAAMFGTDKPSANEIEKARRKLNRLLSGGMALATDMPNSPGVQPTKVYYPSKGSTEGSTLPLSA